MSPDKLLDNVDKWFSSTNSKLLISVELGLKVFGELQSRGFSKDEDGSSLQVAGLSGTYFVYSWRDEAGNTVYVEDHGTHYLMEFDGTADRRSSGGHKKLLE